MSKDKFCVICASVSLTWIVLLILYFLGIFTDKIIIAILMGMSALGLFYLVYDKLSVFKLPFILTLIALIYFILEKFELNTVYFLAILWFFFTLIYFFKSNKNLQVFANKLVECCRKW
ncbi:MAG: hypothetical protein ABIH49_01190 [archaeon]